MRVWVVMGYNSYYGNEWIESIHSSQKSAESEKVRLQGREEFGSTSWFVESYEVQE